MRQERLDENIRDAQTVQRKFNKAIKSHWAKVDLQESPISRNTFVLTSLLHLGKKDKYEKSMYSWGSLVYIPLI